MRSLKYLGMAAAVLCVMAAGDASAAGGQATPGTAESIYHTKENVAIKKQNALAERMKRLQAYYLKQHSAIKALEARKKYNPTVTVSGGRATEAGAVAKTTTAAGWGVSPMPTQQAVDKPRMPGGAVGYMPTQQDDKLLALQKAGTVPQGLHYNYGTLTDETGAPVTPNSREYDKYKYLGLVK